SRISYCRRNAPTPGRAKTKASTMICFLCGRNVSLRRLRTESSTHPGTPLYYSRLGERNGQRETHCGYAFDLGGIEQQSAGASAWEWRGIRNGALCHIVQRSGAEGIQPGGSAAAFLPVQPCHRRIQRGAGGGRDLRNRVLGNRAQRLE